MSVDRIQRGKSPHVQKGIDMKTHTLSIKNILRQVRDHRLEVDEAEGLIEFYEYGRSLQLREKERCARMGIIAEDDDEKNT